MENKVIITAALTGAMTPKDMNPNIPTTPEEIAEDAYACWKSGAAVAHIHMRDDRGDGTMDKDLFRQTAELIRNKCDVIVNMTTSGAPGASDEERMAHIYELKPEMASFDSGSFNWMPDLVFTNSPPFLEKLAKIMIDGKVKPEIEVFDSGMIGVANYYLQKGLILTPPHFQICLGVIGAAAGTVENLVYLRNLLPKDATWSAFAIGKNSLPVLFTTIALGGHVRVGLEDNIYYAKGQLASNVELVERAVRLVNEANKKVASPEDARKILGLKGID